MLRTLLLTDVVDSTARVSGLDPREAAELWARHDTVARRLLVDFGGQEIDKTDGFLHLFPDPASAAAYAAAYHDALGELGLSARAGIHTGEVFLRRTPPEEVALGAKPVEVDGPAKPLAARVMALAGAGQTLASADARDGLSDARSVGHWRLKGIPEPIELFEVGPTRGRPPDGGKAWRVVWSKGQWAPARDVPHLLPAERDAFVGREAEIARLGAAFDGGARLVSLLGMGGAGKTRTAIRFARTWLGDFEGVWFADLVEARTVDDFAIAVARALSVQLQSARPLEQLGHALAARGRCLLVLDNLEQLAHLAEEVVGRWLDTAPDLQILVTTREVLGIPGEHAIALPPLDPDQAVRLFHARAAAGRADYRPEAHDAAVRELVVLLDAIPLAIELVAARIRTLTPEAMCARISDRFRLVAGAGSRNGRQATLRATLDWSWTLLPEAERATLAQLSAFDGGFTLEAAAAVVDPGADTWIEDAVQGLVDRSLVRAGPDDRTDSPRFDLLVTVKEYAAERLAEAGDPDGARLRHAQWYASLGSPDALGDEGAWTVERHRHLQDELANLLSATRWALRSGHGPLAAGAALAAWSVMELSGPLALAADLLPQVAAAPGLSDADRIRLGRAAFGAASLCGRRPPPSDLEQVLALARRHGDPALLGRVLVASQNTAPDDVSEGRLGEALALADRTGDRCLAARARLNLGNVVERLRDPDAAVEVWRLGLADARAGNERRIEGMLLGNLAMRHRQAGRLDEALQALRESLAAHRARGDDLGVAGRLNSLGLLYVHQGDFPEALACYAEASEQARRVGATWQEAQCVANLAEACFEVGDTEGAERNAERALRLATMHTTASGTRSFALGVLARVRLALGTVDDAIAACREAVTLPGTPEMRVTAVCRLSATLLASSAFDEAIERARDACAVADGAADPRLRWIARLALARAQVGAGALDDARASLALAREDGMDRTGATDQARGRLVDASLALAQGDPVGARRHLDEARAILDAGGVGPDLHVRRELAAFAARLPAVT